MYAFDSWAGRLHAHTRTATRPGAGPRHLAFHPSGQHIYVANELDNTVVVYDYNATSGVLCERQIVDTLQPTARAAITGASCVHFHEEGEAYGFL